MKTTQKQARINVYAMAVVTWVGFAILSFNYQDTNFFVAWESIILGQYGILFLFSDNFEK